MTRINLMLLLALALACNPEHQGKKDSAIRTNADSIQRKDSKPLKEGLPIIGLLVFEGVLTTEVTAPLDVFSKHTEAGQQAFNVITIAESAGPLTSEEGLTILPDFTFGNAPELDVLFVPSGYDMQAQLRNKRITDFIRQQNTFTDYTVSNCAGAQLIGASGIADGKRIVTYIGGGRELQKDYPALLVQDDSLVTYVEDGKFLSSNGNLASYISSLELLEKLAGKAHRKYVESYLYLRRLQEWR